MEQITLFGNLKKHEQKKRRRVAYFPLWGVEKKTQGTEHGLVFNIRGAAFDWHRGQKEAPALRAGREGGSVRTKVSGVFSVDTGGPVPPPGRNGVSA